MTTKSNERSDELKDNNNIEKIDDTFWMDTLQDVFLTSLTLVPSVLLGVLAIPAVQSMFYLAPFFDEDWTEIVKV